MKTRPVSARPRPRLRAALVVAATAVTALTGLALLPAAPAGAVTALGHNPVGHIDSVTVDERKYDVVAVQGWAGDIDAGTAGVRVHLYIDGRGAGATSTQSARPDVQRVYPALGGRTGYYVTGAVPKGRGTHTACVYAINVGPGGTTLLGCRSFAVTLPHAIVGHIDSITPDPSTPGHWIMTGWALDPYDAVSPTPIGALDREASDALSSPSYVTFSAGLPRPDVDAAYPRNGHNHGFRVDLAVGSGSGQLPWTAGQHVCLGLIAYLWPSTGVYPSPYCAVFPS